MRFRNRTEAGRVLAGHLAAFRDRKDACVLALPRGGVPVAYEVATKLHVPLDVFIVRKLGLPGQPELAMGAIASGGIVVRNQEVLDVVHVSPWQFDVVVAREQEELERRERVYRGDSPGPQIEGRAVLLVDDGLATGSTMRAAVAAVRARRAASVVVAVPVAPPSACEVLRAEADQVVCAVAPAYFSAVGAWYEDFEQTSEEEVCALLQDARDREKQLAARGTGEQQEKRQVGP